MGFITLNQRQVLERLRESDNEICVDPRSDTYRSVEALQTKGFVEVDIERGTARVRMIREVEIKKGRVAQWQMLRQATGFLAILDLWGTA